MLTATENIHSESSPVWPKAPALGAGDSEVRILSLRPVIEHLDPIVTKISVDKMWELHAFLVMTHDYDMDFIMYPNKRHSAELCKWLDTIPELQKYLLRGFTVGRYDGTSVLKGVLDLKLSKRLAPLHRQKITVMLET